MKKTSNILYKQKSEYGVIEVEDTVYDGEAVCFLKINGSFQSGMYLSKEKRDELVFPYMQRFSYAFHVNPNIQNTFLIGGGAMTYPMYYVKHYPNAQIITCEVSKEVIDIAKKYFGLDMLLEKEAERLQILHRDGIEYLKQHPQIFDLIINDAFISKKPQARDEESTKIVHEHLHKTGIYIVNVSTAISGPFARKGNAYRKLLQKYFKHTVLIAAEEDRNPLEVQNVLMISSDTELL